jgi:hypothetical protein
MDRTHTLTCKNLSCDVLIAAERGPLLGGSVFSLTTRFALLAGHQTE